MIILNALPETYFVNAMFAQISKLPLINYTIEITKAISVVLIIGDLFLKYFKLQGVNDEPFKAYDIVRPLIFIALVMSYSTIIDSVEKGITITDSFVAENMGDAGKLTNALPDINSKDVNITKEEVAKKALPKGTQPDDIEGKTFEVISGTVDYILHPTKILITILEFISNLFSSVIYMSALILRAFMLFFLKVIGGVIIGLSIFDKFKDSFWSWVRYYIIFTLWIIPFYLINIFFVYLNSQSRAIESYMTVIGSGGLGVSIALIAVFLKFTITKASFSWLEKLIVLGGKK